MKVIHLNHSDMSGGAARAAYRIHRGLIDSGIDSNMWVNQAATGDPTVLGPKSNFEKFIAILRPAFGRFLRRIQKSNNHAIHSTAILPSAWASRINKSDADLVHLHWVGGELISIREIGCITKPIIWTLHDSWAFCGAEHIPLDDRWSVGYNRSNRPVGESGLDLNRWTWLRKNKYWQKKPIHIVGPSHWIANCARNSALMHSWPISVVPNCIDTSKWMPVDSRLARQLLGLPLDGAIILFGTSGANDEPHKGFDLLKEALGFIGAGIPGLRLVIFGQFMPKTPFKCEIPVHYLGKFSDDLSMRLLYSAANATLIPSRVDNLPNTALESLSCGTPIVAFDVCGLSDIVEHGMTGYLARPFDAKDFAKGINWIFEQSKQREAELRKKARIKAITTYDNSIVIEQYRQMYEEVLSFSR